MSKVRFRLYRAFPDKETVHITDVRDVFPEATSREYVEIENTPNNAQMITEKAQEGILFWPLFLPRRIRNTAPAETPQAPQAPVTDRPEDPFA